MSGINQTATTTVYINNEAAKAALVELENQLKNVKKARDEAFANGDTQAVKKFEKEIKSLSSTSENLKKKFFDVNAVLKDLSGASLRDLQTALARANTELNKMRRDDPGWETQRRKVEQLRKAVDDAGAASRRGSENAGFFGKAWSGVSSAFGKAIPIIGAAWGAIKGGEAIIESVDSLSDSWAKTLGGVKEALGSVARSIATMDFSNFFTNIREAIKAGREYADTLDHLEDRGNAMAIQEAENERYILDRKALLRDGTKSNEERIKAGKEIIEAEYKLAEARASIAQEAYDNEIKLAMSRSHLSKTEIEDLLRLSKGMEEKLAKGREYNKLLEDEKNLRASVRSSGGQDLVASKKLVETQKQLKEVTDETKKWGETAIKYDNLVGDRRKAITDATVKLYAAQNSAKRDTARDEIRLNQLLAENEQEKLKASEKAIKENAEAKKQAIQNAFDFEKWAYEMSSKEIREWADDAESLYNKVFDAATAASEDILNSGALNPDTTLSDTMIAQKDELDKVLANHSKENLNDRLNAERAILDKNYEEGLLSEEQYQKAIEDIDNERLKKFMESAVAISSGFSDFVNAAQESELASMETRMAAEIKAAGDNKNKLKAIEEKYGKEELAIKKKYADKQFAAQVAQIVVAGALAIMQAFAQLGPIGGAIAAVLIGATTAFQINTANEERKRVKGLKSGGYTARSLSDYTETDLVQYHANEFVSNADAVRNPTVKPVLDIIDMAQRSGTIRTINLPAAVSGMNTRGFQEGGYTSPSASPDKASQPNASNATNQLLITAIQVMSHLDAKIDHIEAFMSMDRFHKDYSEYLKNKEDLKRA